VRMTGDLQPRSVDSLPLVTGEHVDVVEVSPETVWPGRGPALRRSGAPARRRRAAGADRAVLTILFAFFFELYALGRVLGISTLALIGALGILFCGVGTAPLQFSRRVSRPARLAVAGLLGLSTSLVLGFVMVLAPLWHPGVLAAAVFAGACVAHAIALPSSFDDLAVSRSHRPRPRDLLRSASRPSSLCIVVGTLLWLGPAVFTGRIVPGIGGFPTQISFLWFVGIVLVLAGIVLARYERHEGYAAAAVGSLVLALTLTPALVYGMPRSQSAAKHVEFVRLVLASHHLHAGDGIYFAYSAFFDAVAWLCRLAHVSDPTGLATFWPVLMGLIRLVTLRLLFGQLIEGRYRRWAAITLVVLADSIGQDYFAPQAVGFVLALGVFAVSVGARPAVDPRLRAAVVVIASLALAVTHELSPYIVGCVLIALAFARCARPRWAGVAVLAPAILWALINHRVLTGFVSLSSLLNLANFRPPQTFSAPGLSRAPIVGENSHALLLAMLVLSGGALIGFARHRRERWAWAYVISAGIGLVLVAVIPYGREGIFRAAEFGIPWLALMAAYAVPRPSPVAGSAAWMALSLGFLATFLVAAYGMDAAGVMRRADLQAIRIFERAPPNSYLLQIGFGDLPSGPPSPAGRQLNFDAVGTAATQRPGRPRASDLVTLLTNYRSVASARTGRHTGELYAIWSPAQSTYAYEYGLQWPGQANRWRDLMLSSPSWHVVYHDDDTYLFRAVGTSVPRAAS
jgi:hypothetical protein